MNFKILEQTGHGPELQLLVRVDAFKASKLINMLVENKIPFEILSDEKSQAKPGFDFKSIDC